MKIFAFYLPQFHAIPENDKWWGEGFTEWVNVKKAQRLFKGHEQPKKPLNNNYYNLLDVNTLRWQSELLKNYNVDALCFYHYWFTGNQLLQKPAEMLLKNKDIDLPFFFSWANEPWTRTWDGGDKHVLMPQNYGNESDWIEHFNYLLPFFKDERYQKHEGKPIFLLYRSESFIECAEWISCWQIMAKEAGLEGIHFVSMLTSFKEDSRDLGFDAKVYFEPMNTIFHDMNKLDISGIIFKIKRRFKSYTNSVFKTQYVESIRNYDEIWCNLLKKDLKNNTYAGAFVDWDNSPRKGIKSLIVKNSNPEKFYKYFDLLHKKCQKNNVPYIFINAWNEWAEGTYLEPDSKHQYSYLEAIKEIMAKK